MRPENPSAEVRFVRERGAGAAGLEADSATAGAMRGLATDDPGDLTLRVRAAEQRSAGVVTEDEVKRASDEGRLLELVIERSNLLPVWFLNVGRLRASATCKVKAEGTNYAGEQGEWSGTGFMVSPNVLLTNHHVLNSPEVARDSYCIFNYEVDPTGQLLPTKAYHLHPERLFVTSPVEPSGLDFTFVWVNDEPGLEYGFVPLTRCSNKVLSGECANVVQHPNGEPKQLVLQQNEIVWQDEVVVHYVSDTQPGSSGSCVFDNEWLPVALHHASHPASAPEERPHKYVNEGIKVTAIAAYLDKLYQDPAQRQVAGELLALFGGSDALMGFFGSLGRTPEAATGVEAVVTSYRGEASDVDVGFWNLEWFNRDYQQKIDKVAQIIVSMNLDVWAFEEASPQSTSALVTYLADKYRLDYDYAASEPDASPEKQTTTVIWNRKTVDGAREAWPEELDAWFKVDSRHFSDLGLEATEGAVFPRYPGLFSFKAANRPPEGAFDFYLVPLHLKAMDEGSKRRQMAAQILGAAINKMIADYQGDRDWVVGGDFNAALATNDFQKLISGGMVPLSAADEGEGAFSYVKSPKSLIDHIFLSANLAETYGAGGYFIVAQDKAIPGYVRQITDHRPVLVRLSLRETAPAEGAGGGIPESLRKALGLSG